MPDLLKMTEIEAVGFVDAGANPEAEIVIWKRNDSLTPEERDMPDRTAEDILKGLDEGDLAIVQASLDTAAAAIQAAEDRATAAEEALVKSTEKVEPTEDVLKGLDEGARALVEQAIAKADAAEERATAAEGNVAIERAARQRAEMVEIAKGDLPEIESDKLVDVLSAMRTGLESEMFEAATEILRSANEAVKLAKATEAVGNDDKSPTNTVWEKVQKVAKEVAEQRGITLAKAVDAVFRDQPDLYDEYRAEQEGK